VAGGTAAGGTVAGGTAAAGGVVALGHVPGVAEPEPVFTVAEHVRERLALLGRPRREAAAVDLRGLDPRALGRDLTPYQKQVLGLVLAGLAGPAAVALDGFGDGLDADERAGLWALLHEIAAGGTAVLFTAREADPAEVSKVISLGAGAAPDHEERVFEGEGSVPAGEGGAGVAPEGAEDDDETVGSR
jgi:ABC-2 type transport system ATP-binding protein